MAPTEAKWRGLDRKPHLGNCACVINSRGAAPEFCLSGSPSTTGASVLITPLGLCPGFTGVVRTGREARARRDGWTGDAQRYAAQHSATSPASIAAKATPPRSVHAVRRCLERPCLSPPLGQRPGLTEVARTTPQASAEKQRARKDREKT